MRYEDELALARRAAHEAGAHLSTHFLSKKKVISSVGRDTKLELDFEAEAIALKVLAESGYRVLSEERGIIPGDTAGDLTWVVDPLDGSFNYLHGLDMCAVSIALCSGRNPVVAVVNGFLRGEMFHAVREQGAFLNDSSICVSGCTERSQAVLATGLATHGSFEVSHLAGRVSQFQRYKKVRMIGSAALSLAYVACGRFDAYCERGIMWWDTAAGILLVSESGGSLDVMPGQSELEGLSVDAAASPLLIGG